MIAFASHDVAVAEQARLRALHLAGPATLGISFGALQRLALLPDDEGVSGAARPPCRPSPCYCKACRRTLPLVLWSRVML
jgi:hypothetical protein